MPSQTAPQTSAKTTEFPVIEVFANQYPTRNYVITVEVPEFTSVCPKTGLPDFGAITIDYVPDQYCLELKAFKYYTLAYRNHGIFYENVVNKILEDIVAAAKPRYVEVTGEFNARGGLSTSVTATHRQDGFEFDA